MIVEYLDHLAGGGRLHPAGDARFPVLRLQALADGLMDANILILYEGRWRDASRHEPKWLEHQKGKVARALDALAAEAEGFLPGASMRAPSPLPARLAIWICASKGPIARAIPRSTGS